MTYANETGDLTFAAYCLTVPPANPIETIKPLKSVEWVRLTSHLATHKLRPSDLLSRTHEERVDLLDGAGLDSDRIDALLDRSGQAAIELQRWTDNGIWLCTRDDEHYPAHWIEHLGDGAPPLLFGVGEKSLMNLPGVAIVGSRNVDEAGTEFARASARSFARANLSVVSGGARGVDREAMSAALDAGGTSVGVMSDNLARAIREAEVRAWLEDQRLALVSPYRPDAGFHVGTAMGRNRLIYCLSQAAIVVATEVDRNGVGKGGTWAGAVENLKHGWVPLYVRADEIAPAANLQLLAVVDKSGRRATPLTSAPEDGVLPDPLPPLAKTDTAQQLSLT